MVVLWLALRLALGRGSWPLLGVAAGIGLETKYTLAVVLVLLIATFLVWRRDVLRSRGFPLARRDRGRAARPEPRLGGRPRLDERALLPQPAAQRQRRDAAAVHRQPDPAHGRGVPGRRRRSRVAHPRPRAATARLDGRRHRRRLLRARRQVVLRAAGAAVRARRRRDPARSLGDAPPLQVAGGLFVVVDLVVLPLLLPVLPLHTAVRHGVIKARGDYQSEVGWPAYVRQVEHARGRRGRDRRGQLRRSGSARTVRPRPAARRVGRRHHALLAPAGRRDAGRSSSATPATPPASAPATASSHASPRRTTATRADEPIARCTLRGTLAKVWPRIIATRELGLLERRNAQARAFRIFGLSARFLCVPV